MSLPGHRQLEHLPMGRIRQSVVPILTRIRRSLRYSDTKTGSVPLWPILLRSQMMPYRLIVFLQVKEETNCLLPLSKGICEISFKAHQEVGRATMFSETTLASV